MSIIEIILLFILLSILIVLKEVIEMMIKLIKGEQRIRKMDLPQLNGRYKEGVSYDQTRN